jgi:hypothetical protein
VGISPTKLCIGGKLRLDFLLLSDGPLQTGASHKGATPHTAGALFSCPSPVLPSKHGLTPITELNPKALLLSACQRAIASAGASNGGVLGSQRADLRGMRGSAPIFSLL